MRGSQQKDRRLKRAGAIFSLVGLVMTVFLAIGQVGLIAANADGWSDSLRRRLRVGRERTRRRLHRQSIDAVSEKSSSSKDSVAAPLVAARAVDVGDIELDWIAAGPYTYNHSTLAGTGPGLPEYDGRVIDKSTGVFDVHVPSRTRVMSTGTQGRLLPRDSSPATRTRRSRRSSTRTRAAQRTA